MNPKFTNRLIYSSIFILALPSFFLIYVHGVNIPHWDDHAVRVFVEEYSWSNVGAILDFHNEHRIATTRLAALKINWIFGSLNYKTLMYVGQIGLLGLMAAYIFLATKINTQKWTLIVLSMFIFNFSTYENTLWAMASIQNHWVICWSILSLVCLVFQDSKKTFLLAILFSGAALLTSGNAILIAPIGLLILWFSSQKKEALYWFIAHVIFYGLYFLSFQASDTGSFELATFVFNFLALNGSFFYPILGRSISPEIIVSIGALNLLIALFVVYKLFTKETDKKIVVSFIAIQLFFLGTIFLVSLSRSFYDVEIILSSKYKIYSFLLLGSSLFYGFSHLPKIKNSKMLILLLAAGLFINAQASFWRPSQGYQLKAKAEVVNLKNTSSPLYFLPTFDFESHMNTKGSKADPNKVDSIVVIKEHVYFYENDMTKKSKNYIFLKSKSYKYLAPMIPNNSVFSEKKGGLADLLLFNFPSDVYEVYYLEIGRKDIQLFNTKKTINIEGVPFKEAPKNW